MYGTSTVSTSAPNPCSTASSISPSVTARSLNTYTWNQRVPPAAQASATSRGERVAADERHMIVPAAAAARAVAASPSGCAIRWNASGAIRIGSDTSVPSTVVAVEIDETSTSTRGRSLRRLNAARFSSSVTSSPEPPAKYASALASSLSAARRSYSQTLTGCTTSEPNDPSNEKPASGCRRRVSSAGCEGEPAVALFGRGAIQSSPERVNAIDHGTPRTAGRRSRAQPGGRRTAAGRTERRRRGPTGETWFPP